MNEQDGMSRGVPAAAVIIGAAILSILAIMIGGARFDNALFWMIVGLIVVLLIFSCVLLYRMKPQVFQRRWGTDPIERGYELTLMVTAAIGAVATCALSAVDYFRLSIGYMGSWVSLVGMVLLCLGVVLYQQAALSYGPHHKERYGELPGENATQGTYAQVRHPLISTAVLSLLGVPLLLSSWIGLIAWAVTALVLMTYVSREDGWRFVNYEWYYDYTQLVRYKMIPLLW